MTQPPMGGGGVRLGGVRKPTDYSNGVSIFIIFIMVFTYYLLTTIFSCCGKGDIGIL